METLGSLAAVIAALEEDGRAELERLQAEAHAPAPPAPVEAGAERAAEEKARRLGEARRTAATAEAEQAWLDRRAELEDREAWFAEVADEALSALGGELPPALLERWAAEAFEAIGTEDAEVRLAPEDARLLEAGARQRLHVVEDLTLARGSCLGLGGQGTRRFDNGVRARAERTRGSWRARLAEVHRR